MPDALRALALKLLARREHTRAELERKLGAHVEDPAGIARVLDDLSARGWLSDTRAAEQLIHVRKGRFGVRRIERELRDRGVSAEAADGAVRALKAGELDRARAVWQRKFGQPPANARERARQVRFLQGRGFDLDVIFKVVGGEEDD